MLTKFWGFLPPSLTSFYLHKLTLYVWHLANPTLPLLCQRSLWMPLKELIHSFYSHSIKKKDRTTIASFWSAITFLERKFLWFLRENLRVCFINERKFQVKRTKQQIGWLRGRENTLTFWTLFYKYPFCEMTDWLLKVWPDFYFISTFFFW